MGWCVSYWNSISLTTARVEAAGGLSLAQQLCPLGSTSPKPHCCVLPRRCLIKEEQFHIANMLRSLSARKKWQLKAFQPSQMPSRLHDSCVQSDPQLSGMSSLRAAGQATCLSPRYKSPGLLRHAPSHLRLTHLWAARLRFCSAL